MFASRHFIPLKHLRAVLRLGQLGRYFGYWGIRFRVEWTQLNADANGSIEMVAIFFCSGGAIECPNRNCAWLEP